MAWTMWFKRLWFWGRRTEAGHIKLGRHGERLARRRLKREGFKIVAANVRLDGGEIDIVATEGDTLCFVEVKTRRRESPAFHTHSNLTPAKQARVVRAARQYVKRHRLYDVPRRYDFVGVVYGDGANPEVELIRDAWRPRG